MHRVLYEWRRLRVRAYPAMLYLGTVLGILAGTRSASRHGLGAPRVQAAMLLLLPPTWVGARLLFVAMHWRAYRREPGRIWRRSEGGAALYGGLVAGFLASLPLLRALRLSVWAFWDAGTITMLVGMIFTRVGCLLNGCCAGRATEGLMGLRLPNLRGAWSRRVPTQPLEAGFAAALLAGALAAWDHVPANGAVFLAALASYASGRWMLEPARETVDRVGRVSVNLTLSAVLAALSLAGLLAMATNAPRGPIAARTDAHGLSVPEGERE